VVVLIIVIATASVVIGFLIGRWAIPIVLAAGWLIYVIGRKQEWWGSGVGDGWQVALLIGTVIAALAGAAGVLARHRIKPTPWVSPPGARRRGITGER
jgi:hypothetical protein